VNNRANLLKRLFGSWNLFKKNENKEVGLEVQEGSYSSGSKSPHKYTTYGTTTKTVVSGIFNRLALDISLYDIKHVVVDENGQIKSVVQDSLHQIFNSSANIDQSGSDFVRDIVISMFDEGVVALVPIDTDVDTQNSTFKVETMRTGRIIGWHPGSVRMRVYNDLPNSGRYEEITKKKTEIGILENPLYLVMNEKGSLLQRLITKLNTLDTIDNQAVSGKLDLLMQFPFSIKSNDRKKQAENRREELETQLKNSEVGVAYIDAVEKIIQLNRPVTNNVLAHVAYLTTNVYSQLGITEAIFNGTADNDAIANYFVRSIQPILKALTQELTRKFISQTAYTQGHRIMYFANPFSFVAPSLLSDFIDKTSRNEILTGNEIRSGIGYIPSQEESANELRNKNINKSEENPPVEKGDTSEQKQISKKA
jgi:hypothetical protein